MALTHEQMRVMECILHEKRSIFISGEAGTGKSFVVQSLRKQWQANHVKHHITATTGISAFHLRGMTIHSCLGIGTIICKAPLSVVLQKVRRNRAALDRIRSMDVLLIDEISMMPALMWERINVIFQTLRRCYDRPFGGCQMVVMGDFFQLLPVFQEADQDTRLVFESSLWTEMFSFDNKNIIVFTVNFRQAHDNEFHQLLHDIRHGDIHVDLDKLTTTTDHLQEGMYLVPTRKRAFALNMMHLRHIPSVSLTFEAVFSGRDEERIADMKYQFESIHMNKITLKKGCRVMLLCNLDISKGLINGSLGTVTELQSSLVMVQFDHLPTCVPITHYVWKADDDETKAMVRQIPLMIAYALTIHKSQSLTLDYATLELAQCFAPHQAYVALSRLKTMKGLRVASVSRQAIFCDARVISYMKSVEEALVE